MRCIEDLGTDRDGSEGNRGQGREQEGGSRSDVSFFLLGDFLTYCANVEIGRDGVHLHVFKLIYLHSLFQETYVQDATRNLRQL